MRMLRASRRVARLAGIIVVEVACAVTCGWCADPSDTTDPLLDLFIKKGFVTQKEAEEVQAEAEALRTNETRMPSVPPPKWRISEGIKNVELFGDIRLRFEDRSAEDLKGGSIDLQRLRYDVRVGLRGEAFDDFYYGMRLEPSSNPRSSWLTLGSSSSGIPYQGPFGKSTAGINVGQAYLGWRPWDWVDVTVGKMPNPLYTTPMVWDGDLNPEGAAEHFKYTVGEADFFANFGQFLYQDTNPTHTAKNYFGITTLNNSELPFLLAWQGGVNYHLTKKVNFKVAPVLYQYFHFYHEGTPITGGVGPDFDGTYVGQGQAFGPTGPAFYNLATGSSSFDGFYANQTGINDLLVLEFPFELDVKMKKLNLRLFGDFAQNLEGADRARAAYNAAHSFYFSASGPGAGAIQQITSPQTHDDRAYQIGIDIASPDGLGLVDGSTSRKHAWELKTYWQHIEQYALDPNLIDSDVFEGRENMEGIYVAVAYGFTDNFIGTFHYGHASRINDKLGTGGSNQDIPQMNPINSFDLFQVDLTFKF